MAKKNNKKEVLDKLAHVQTVKRAVTDRIWREGRPVEDMETHVKLTSPAIKHGTAAVAKKFIKENPGANPVVLGMMDGGLPFLKRFQKELYKRHYPFTCATMQASSYGTELSGGDLKILSLPKVPVGGRIVVIADDLCERGVTFQKVKDKLLELGATKVILVVLIDKVQPRKDNYTPEYAAFKVKPDKFLVGYGMDCERELRNHRSVRGVKLSSLANPTERAVLDSEGRLNEELRHLIASEHTLFGASASKARKMTAEDSLLQTEELLPISMVI